MGTTRNGEIRREQEGRTSSEVDGPTSGRILNGSLSHLGSATDGYLRKGDDFAADSFHDSEAWKLLEASSETADNMVQPSLGGEPDARWGVLTRAASAAQAKGDYPAANALCRRALALASNASMPEGAAMATMYLAYFEYQLGHLAAAETLVRRAREAAGGLGDDGDGSTSAQARLIVPCLALEGGISGLRGHWHRATNSYSRAFGLVDESTPNWIRCLLHTSRAAAIAPYDCTTSLSDLARAEELRDGIVEEPVEFVRWRISDASGVVALHTGDVPGAIKHFSECCEVTISVWHTAVAMLRCAKAHFLSDGRAEAGPLASRAVELLEAINSSYWLAQALLVLAELDPEVGASAMAQIDALDDGDPAFELLVSPRRTLRIDVGVKPGAWLGSDPILFIGRQAEFTLYALALAGPAGLSLSKLSELMWPSPTPSRLSQRVRTLLWQVRVALGEHGWRLVRDGDRLVLDDVGIAVDKPEDPDGILPNLSGMGNGVRGWLNRLVEECEHPAKADVAEHVAAHGEPRSAD